MTKITVDKEMALRAVYLYFNIPLVGTEPSLYKKMPAYPVEIIFDFEKDCSKCIPQNIEFTVTKPTTLIIKENE